MHPIKLKAPCKDYIWGGTRLRDEYQKGEGMEKIAESWELSCHKDGQSIVASGDFSGYTLSSFIEKNGKQILGTNCEKFDDFPILIKLIDAKDNLSVQVHPDNEYALRVEKEYGKTEMWYIVDCDPDAELIYGFKEVVTEEVFKKSIETNTLLEITNSVPVKKGDVFFIEAGTLHAIGKGILIAEIQQNSNTTYRVYDYGRLGTDGKPRELHIEKALEVTHRTPPPKPAFQSMPVLMDGYSKTLLSLCDYFRVHKLDVQTRAVLNATNESFHSILVLDGEFKLSDLILTKGDSAFVPAGMGQYQIQGNGTVLLTDIP